MTDPLVIFMTETCERNKQNKRKSYKDNIDDIRIPVSIVVVSILQILLHIFSTPTTDKYFRFEPDKRSEIWRYITYMLVHEDWAHLILNIVIQCIFAAPLERQQGSLRVLTIYLAGGATGVLGATCVNPNLIIGSSAGGYSLLLSNASDLIVNYETSTYRRYRSITIGILVLFDIVYDIVHVMCKKKPQVSWQTHLAGAITGLLIGLILFKCHDNTASRRSIFWICVILYCCLVIAFIIIIIQIERCTPSNQMMFQYRYFC
ncbi:serine protease rhomboid 6 isoform X2 [Rhynchophorus ferrugineus]|uniref:serine protease rhomboid 6 isoform X2 n=1 Tax=Rhynchophorus ferrugineus TaxID=354439 RepID=UPI003FCDECE2